MKRKQVYYNQDTGKFEQQKSYGEFEDIPSAPGGAASYLVYTALLSQSGTDAPVATILENTLGNIVWTRFGTGVYRGTLAGVFTENKVICLGTEDSALGNFAFSAARITDDYITIDDYDDTWTPVDGLHLSLEIRVYL